MERLIDKIQNYWDTYPCNSKHSRITAGTRDYFDAVSLRRYTVEPHIRKFAEFDNNKIKTVLEIGCGIGTDAVEFARAGKTFTGVELSDVSLDIAKQRFRTYDLIGRFYSGNAEYLSDVLPGETYDLIYSFGVIHHSPEPQRIIDNIKLYMNKNTQLKVMLYANNSWKNFMIQNGLDQPEAQSGCPLVNTYTKEQVELLFKDFNITIEQDHIFPYKFQEYRQGEYVKQQWFEAMPYSVFRTLEQNLGWHLLISAKLKR